MQAEQGIGGGRASALAPIAGLLAIAGFIWVVFYALTEASFDVAGGLLVAVGLVVLNTPFLLRVAAAEQDRFIGTVIFVAFIAKLVASGVRYFVAYEVYGGVADASEYARWGTTLAALFRDGTFAVDLGRPLIGTGFIRYITGLVFAVTGPTTIGGFLVFATLSFWGLYAFYRAFRHAFPDGDHRRYAVLVMTMPTLLYWPSSIGKEAWMLLALGLAAFGASRVLTRTRGGYVPLVLGIVAATLVRPHIAALICAALVAGYLRRPRPDRSPLLGPVAQIVGFAIIVVGSIAVAERVESQFDLTEDTTVSRAQQLLDITATRTTQGGSELEVQPIRGPLDVPRGIVTVLFRPFPWEADSAQTLLSALEGVILLGLFALSFRRLATLPRQLWRHSYARYAITFSLLFMLAFASIGNFGILARQRSQLYPHILIVLAIPVATAAPIKASVRN